MIRTLIRKDLIEHGWMFAMVIAMSLFGFLLVLIGTTLQEAGSSLDSVRFYGVTLNIVMSMVICNRLVVHEYSGKTQLFLEGLPVSRSAMLWTKYLLGFVIVASTMACCFLFALAIASRQEMIGLRFVLIMTSRWVAFVFVTYSFFFMMGLLGRYRIPLYACLGLSLMILSDATSLDITQHGPLALLNDKFAFERFEFPVRSLVECVTAGGVFIGIAMLMGLVREGSVASLLAERMSHREKLFAAVVIFSLLFTGSFLDEKRKPDPYTIPNAYVRESNQVSVYVESIEDDVVGDQLADQIHADLVSMRDYLAIESVPELFLVNRRDLDSDQFEPAKLQNASGILLRANYVSSDWKYETFRPFLIDVSLSRISHFNAIHEPQCWVLEGFSEYWPRHEAFDAQWNESAAVDRRAAYGVLLGVEEEDIDQWYRYRDRVGESIARSIACSGLVFAERKYGAEKLQSFLREVMRTDQPDDVRADLHRLRLPIEKVWQQTIGSDYREFLRDWLEEVDSLYQTFSERIDKIPRLTADASWVPKSAITYELVITPRCQPNAETNSITVRYEELSAFDQWQPDRLAESQIELYEPGSTITVNESFAVGSRARWTTSLYVPQLECDVISGWQREEVK